MLRYLKRHEVWVFLWGIVIVNALFVGAIANKIIPFKFYGYGRFALLAAVLVAVIFLARGWRGIVELLRPMLVWRVHPGWFVLAYFWGIANCILVLLIKGIVTGNGLEQIEWSLQLARRPGVLAVVAVSSFVGEIVWVSYAIRRLTDRFTPYIAGLIVGIFWTLWWVPMVLLNIGVVANLPLAALLLNQMGVAAMCAFFYWHSRSGLVVLVLQMMVNLSILIFPVAPVSGGIPTYWVFALTYFATALIMFLMFGPKPLYRTNPYERAAMKV